MSNSPDNGSLPGGGRPLPPLQAVLAEAAAAFSKDPGGAARRLLDTAERALAGAIRNSGGRDPLPGLAAAASRLMSGLQSPGPGAAPPADSGLADARQASRPAAPSDAPAAPPSTPFVALRQQGATWSFHVRADMVDAVVPTGEAGCVLHLSDGSTLEAGECSDDAARRLPRLPRLSQPAAQQGLYVRPEAVLAVSAPAGGGCVLRLRGGRELAATEAAAVAVGLLAGGRG